MLKHRILPRFGMRRVADVKHGDVETLMGS
jgi:hypothetical protein